MVGSRDAAIVSARDQDRTIGQECCRLVVTGGTRAASGGREPAGYRVVELYVDAALSYKQLAV